MSQPNHPAHGGGSPHQGGWPQQGSVQGIIKSGLPATGNPILDDLQTQVLAAVNAASTGNTAALQAAMNQVQADVQKLASGQPAEGFSKKATALVGVLGVLAGIAGDELTRRVVVPMMKGRQAVAGELPAGEETEEEE